MAVQIGSMYASITLDVGPYASNMARAVSVTERGAGRIARSAGLAQASVNRFSGSMGSGSFRPYSMIAVSRAFENAADRAGLLRGSMLALTGVFGGFGAALSTNLVLRYADNFAKLNNLVRVVSDGQADLASRFNEVFEAANRSRSSLEATAVLYSRIQKASPDIIPERILQYTETIQKALTLGGASVQESRSAAIQFSQAIASNRLGGEELRAILETPLGLELARGLGVTIGKFREMGHAGQLTADVVLGALAKIGPSIDAQFRQSTVTLDQSLTILDNKLTKYIGEVNRAYGATSVLGSGIKAFGDNLESIMPVIGAAALAIASAFTGRFASGMFSRVTSGWRAETNRLAGEAKVLREEYNSLQQKVLESELKRSQLATTVRGDTDAFADKSVVDAYKRSQQDIAGLDAKALAIKEQISAETKNLSDIYSKTSPRIVKLTQDMVNAETRLAAAKERQSAIQKQLNTRYVGESQARYQARSDALMKESNALLKQQARDMETVASRRVALNNLMAESDRARAAAATTSLRNIANLNRQLSDVNLSRDVAVLETRDARQQIVISGARNAQRALLDQATAVRQNQQAFTALADKLQDVERAQARSVGVVGLMRNAWGGFIGALGGPWGAGISAAIVLLGALGAAAARSAQKVADADAAIKARLQQSADAGDSQAQISLNAGKLKEIEQTIKNIRDTKMDLVIRGVDAAIASATGSLGGMGYVVRAALSYIAEPFRKLERDLFDGNITAEQFTRGLQELGNTSPLHRQLADAILSQKDALIAAASAAQAYGRDLDKVARPRMTGRQRMGPSLEERMRKEGKWDDDLEDDLYQSQLRAKGKTAEAKADEFLLRKRKQGIELDREYVVGIFKEIEANDKRAAAIKKSDKAAESFAQKLALLKEASEGAFLGDIDRSVIQQARQWKIATGEIEKYIAAANKGDFSGISDQMKQIRDAKIFEAAGREARNIVQEYGNWSQISPIVAERQAILNEAVRQGAISADQASVAMGKFVAGFGQYKWIEDASRAFTDFLESAVTGTKTWTEALEDLRKAIVRIALEELALRPIRDLLRNGMSWAAGTPGISPISFGTSLVGGAGGIGFASGGVIGGIGTGKSDSNIIRASRGEFIVNAEATSRHRRLLEMINSGVGQIRLPAFAEGGIVMPASTSVSGSLESIGANDGPPVEIHIHKVPSDMTANAKTSQKPGGGYRIDIELSKQVDKMVAANIRSGRSDSNKAIEERYGSDPTRGIG